MVQSWRFHVISGRNYVVFCSFYFFCFCCCDGKETRKKEKEEEEKWRRKKRRGKRKKERKRKKKLKRKTRRWETRSKVANIHDRIYRSTRHHYVPLNSLECWFIFDSPFDSSHVYQIAPICYAGSCLFPGKSFGEYSNWTGLYLTDWFDRSNRRLFQRTLQMI